ncbi:hypothetical protein [Streptomyces sp. BE230]|nr:hypothetical protein [Streptomyces sp. BE230]
MGVDFAQGRVGQGRDAGEVLAEQEEYRAGSPDIEGERGAGQALV